MKTLIMLILLSCFVSACSKKPSSCDFNVGDTVEPYRHWNHDSKGWNNYPEQFISGTKWRVLEPDPDISRDHLHVQLVVGIYKLGDETRDLDLDLRLINQGPGYVDSFVSSDNYIKENPYSPSQFCEEFRVVRVRQ